MASPVVDPVDPSAQSVAPDMTDENSLLSPKLAKKTLKSVGKTLSSVIISFLHN